MGNLIFEQEYITDTLRWIRYCEEKNLYFEDEKTLDYVQKEIISKKDTALAYFFAAEFNYKNYLMQKVILQNKDAKYAVLYAQNVKNCNIQALQAIVAESKNNKYICNFACFVYGCDTKFLEKKLKNISAKHAHMMIKYTNAAISKYKEIIFKSKRPRYLFELAKHNISKKDLSNVEDLIIKAKSYTYIRLLAAKIKNANISKLENAILETNNTDEIKKFALSVKRSKMKNFLIVI